MKTDKTLCLIAALLLSVPTFAQKNNTGISLAPMLGASYPTHAESGICGGSEINLYRNHLVASFAYLYAEELDILGKTPNESYNQLNITIGKTYGKENGLVRFHTQAGLSAFWGVKRGKLIDSQDEWLDITTSHEKVDFFTIGLPVKAGVSLIPLRYMGVGLDLQANLNATRTVFMPVLRIEFGKLR